MEHTINPVYDENSRILDPWKFSVGKVQGAEIFLRA